MCACVHSRLALRMLLKFGRCAEGLIVCNRTCWRLRSRAPDALASDGPRTIPQKLRNTTPLEPQVNDGGSIRGLLHFPASAPGPTREESRVMNHYSSTTSRSNFERVFYSRWCFAWLRGFPTRRQQAAASI
jgi:hypothetical protein